MKYLLILSLTVFTLSSYADITLPDYGEENLVSDEDEKRRYFEAIELELRRLGIENCHRKWDLATDVLVRSERDTELYKLDSESPLFVVRLKIERNAGFYFLDFKIFTKPEMTELRYVNHVSYFVETSKRVNVGSLVNPEIVERDVVAQESVELRCPAAAIE